MRFFHSAVSDWFRGDAVIVTPSPLLATVIQHQNAESQIAGGNRSWRPAPVLSISAWLRQNWRELRSRLGADIPGLLSPAQELLLWQRAIQESNGALFDVAETARTARRVARSIAEWGVPMSHPAWDDDEDAQTYLRWWTSVRNRCAEQNWMCATDLWATLSKNSGHLAWAGRVVFAGFPDPAPALRSLAAKLSGQKVAVEFTRSEAAPVTAQVLPCGTPEEEFDLAARWARASYENDPASSVALLVPDLRSRRSSVEDSLRNVFYPASVVEPVQGKAPLGSIFHIHSGRPLREHPVIATALRILDLAENEIPLTTVSALLRSPFIRGAGSERAPRSATDVRIRSPRELAISFDRLQEKTVADCAVLGSIWSAVRKVLAGQPRGTAECATWARCISALLKAAGWPGDAELTPLEQAAADQWRELLSTLGSLGLISGAVSWRDALRLLGELASVDGPVSGDLQSPVQVLDPIDATSIQFDRAWSVGLSHGEWPKLSPSTPFIPPVLQRLSQMPSMPDGRERESARAIDALHQSARSVFGSFSAEGGRTPSLSARIKDFVLRETDEIPLWSGKALLDRIRPAALEEVDDTHGPVYRIQGKALGGSYLIKSQSSCPFRAFTESRLHAREWDEGVFAFDQRDRGKFIHQAFAMFWQQVRDSETLHQLSPTELSKLIETVAERALSGDREFTVFRDQLRKAEQERIGRILHAWLEIEKNRTVPFTVREVEAEYNVSLAGLPFQLRIDRIDELQNGGLVVIDYKSGNPQQKGLDGERPKEPQLLVYAAALAASGANVEGIYFGKLQARDEQAIGYAGRVNFGTKKETVKRDWNDQLQRWTQLVHGLAEEFVNGYALTMPDSKVCKFCPIKPVCRMTEASRLSAADGESE